MKKLVIIFSFSLIVVSSQAQFNYGLGLGFTTTDYHTPTPSLVEGGPGYSLGLVGRYGNSLFVDATMMYMQSYRKMWVARQTYDNQIYQSIKTSLSLGWKAYKSDNGKASFQLLTGPTLVYLLNKKPDYESLLTSPLPDTKISCGLGAGFTMAFFDFRISSDWTIAKEGSNTNKVVYSGVSLLVGILF